MSLIATSGNGGGGQLSPEGIHPARCVWTIGLGTQIENYNGKEKRQLKVRLAWELPLQKSIFKPEEGEMPFIVSREYTNSLYAGSNLRHVLESWRGKGLDESELKGFDLSRLLGAPAMVGVIHRVSRNHRTYPNVTSVTRVPKGMKVPAQILPSLKYDITEGAGGVFEKLPKFIRDRIMRALEWNAEPAQDQSNGHDEQPEESGPPEIPF